jgi:Zn-dependent M28 family amino/carboxypeptidase
MVAARESAIVAQLPQAAEQLATIRGATRGVILEMPGWSANVTVAQETLRSERAPNTVGILEGTDPTLRNEYVVFSAHMDHVGTRTGMTATNGEPVDSIFNGADDDASGTVGIVELAEAFAATGARPKRSMIFLAVSGEEKGLWGSEWFGANPPVPIGQLVANLNADMIGRNWPDTIVVIGKEHSDLGETLGRVSTRHPELRMAAIDDRWPEQNFYQRSDHYNFAKRGVPVLFFFNGTHEDYHRASDHADKIDAEKLARIAQLMYWIGQEVGNAAERPRWKPESYTKYVTAR